MAPRTKDVVIGDTTYQIGSFALRDASWIVGQFLMSNLLFRLENADKEITDQQIGAGFAGAFSLLPEGIFNSIQSKCFAVCGRHDGEAVLPLFMKNDPNRWTGPPLDPLQTTVLLISVLVFNLKSFFEPGARKTLMMVFPDLSAPAESTGISSDQSSGDTGDKAS